MTLSIKFLGAARNVTGSAYMLRSGDRRILVDCGMFQERQHQKRNWDPFPIDPGTLDAVLLTHAHLDHVGRLPLLVKQGFRGPVYCTGPTVDIVKIVLEDSGRIQEDDAAFKAKRHRREGRRGAHPEVPLYTAEDARACFRQLIPVRYDEPLRIGGDLEATFHDAGHILGSAMIQVRAGTGDAARTILFSGDIGRWDKPIIRDPTSFERMDYILIESTYGDRNHVTQGDIEGELGAVVNATCSAGGNLVVPSFAIERTHELLYHLHSLMMKKVIPRLLVFVDSPMAVSVTEVFKQHPEVFDEEMLALLQSGRSPFGFPTLHLVRAVEDSKAINQIKGTAIVIAGSGMCNAGRIKHHLVNNIARPESTVLFVGYQAHGTLGRHILDGNPRVRIFGREHEVRMKVAQIQGFSGHADRDELIRWISTLRVAPRKVFVTHGEEDASAAFTRLLNQKTGWNVANPDYLEEVRLD